VKIASIFLGMPVGGAEDLSIGLARALSSRDIETQFVCLRSLDVLGEELTSEGWPVTLLPSAQTKRFSLGGMKHLADWLRSEKIDIVHSHTYHSHTYAIPAASRAGIPAILHHHKTLEKMKWHRWWTMCRLARRATRVLTLSQKTAGDIRASFHLPAGKVQALPNAINESDFFSVDDQEKMVLRQNLGLPAGKFLFLTVASLQEIKNHALLLQSIDFTQKNRPQQTSSMEFVFLGDGPQKTELESRLAAMDETIAVRMPGSRRPIAPWLQCADAFVLPSKWEGQSLALLQAIHCGLPILASRIEGNTAILGESHPGLFDLERPDQLAALLQECAGNAGFRHKLVSFQRTLQLPSWAGLVNQLEQIYRALS